MLKQTLRKIRRKNRKATAVQEETPITAEEIQSTAESQTVRLFRQNRRKKKRLKLL
jgi:hypothetical protein